MPLLLLALTLAVGPLAHAQSASGCDAPGPFHADDTPAWSSTGRTVAFVRWASTRYSATPVLCSVQTNKTAPRPIVVGAPPFTFAWAPNGERIAYQSAGRLWVVGATGGEPVSVYPRQDAGLDLAWAPDGSRIAFVLSPFDGGGGSAGLFTIRPDGSGLTMLAPGAFLDLAWSPDGAQIAFFGDAGLAVMSSNGTGMVTLAPTRVGHLAWSPDSSTIAFDDDTGPNPPAPSIRLADVATDAVRRIASGHDPAWSPDGTRLGYSVGYRNVASGLDSLRIRDLKTGRDRAVAIGTEPDWSPDGTGIAYVTPCGGIGLVRTDGSQSKGTGWRPLTFDCRVFGTSGPDRLHGPRRKTTDMIYGLAGNDQIRADGGDVAYGGSGNDTIRARNREFDEIWCGPGEDRVFADRIDKVGRDCEAVHR